MGCEDRTSTGGVRLLIVDDQLWALEASKEAIRSYQDVQLFEVLFESKAGESATEALTRVVDQIMSIDPRIVLMDQQMPPISGADVIREVRRRLGGDEIVFIANSSADPGPLNEAGAVGDFRKGQNESALRDAIGRLASQ